MIAVFCTSFTTFVMYAVDSDNQFVALRGKITLIAIGAVIHFSCF
jgi:hypothetical protein